MKKSVSEASSPMDGLTFTEYVEKCIDNSATSLVQRIVDKLITDAIIATHIEQDIDGRYASLRRYIVSRVNAKIDSFFEEI